MYNRYFLLFLHMFRFLVFFLLIALFHRAGAQEVTLPVDLRQHNLTEYNASFFNAAFALNRNNPQSVVLWTRWQWQVVDGDPTTIFLNYTRKLNAASSISGGFFQHNTGVFLNTGGVLNYSYAYEFSSDTRFGVGANLFGFSRSLADDRTFIDPQIELPNPGEDTNFIMEISPGVFFQWKKMTLGFSAENLFDYNFTTSERDSGPESRRYLTSLSFDYSLGGDKNSTIRPTLYYKTINNHDNQIGGNLLYSTDRYWGQAGYNSFYGVSVGAGGRLFRKISMGALMEFATDSDLEDTDPTFELVLAYHIGAQFEKEKATEEEKEEELAEEEKEDTSEEKLKEAAKKEADALKRKELETKKVRKEQEEKLRQEQLQADEKAKNIAALKKVRARDSLNALTNEKNKRKEQAIAAQKRIDSIKKSKELEKVALAKRKKDSLDRVAALAKKEKPEVIEKEKVSVVANEKYEEVVTEDGLLPGFYLIANVFGTKKYYEAFMKDLKNKGLDPKSFLRNLNKYNYVYLKRYDTMYAARKARDNKFEGRYTDKTWIFRVVGE